MTRLELAPRLDPEAVDRMVSALNACAASLDDMVEAFAALGRAMAETAGRLVEAFAELELELSGRAVPSWSRWQSRVPPLLAWVAAVVILVVSPWAAPCALVLLRWALDYVRARAQEAVEWI